MSSDRSSRVVEVRPLFPALGLLLAFAAWTCLILLPWQPWLERALWVRFALGLAGFILPGILPFSLLDTDGTGWMGRLPFGFTLSLLMVTVLGLLARLAHLTMRHIEITFWLVGVLSIGLVFQQSWRGKAARRAARPLLSTLMDIWPLLLASLLIGLITTRRLITDDDLIYLAYQTYFERSASLGFKEIIFGADQLSPARFWIVSVPFAQALQSRIAHIPAAMFAAGLYGPLLVVLSAVAFYRLFRALGLSTRLSALAVVCQFTFLVLLAEYLHAGSPFLNQLDTDKASAAFIITPVFLESMHRLFRRPEARTIVLALLTALSLSTAHPVIFVFAAFIAGLIALLGVERANFTRRLLLPGAILVSALLPQVAVRFSGHESSALIDQSRSEMLHQEVLDLRIRAWGDGGLYGLNPALLAMRFPYEERLSFLPPALLHFGWLLFPLLAGFFALKEFRRDEAARYILASLALVLLVLIPWLAWFFGTLTTPGMLERTVWLFPFGLGFLWLLTRLRSAFPRLLKRDSRTFTVPAQVGFTVLCLAIILLFMREGSYPGLDRLHSRQNRYQELVDIGAFLDRENGADFTIAGTDQLNDLIPIFTIHGKLVSFRPSDRTYSYFIPPELHAARMTDRQKLFSSTATREELLSICRKYHITYLLLEKDDWERLKPLVFANPDVLTRQRVTGSFVLLSVDY